MRAGVDFDWEEFNGAQIKKTIDAATKRGLYLAGEHILNVSNRQVPHEDGDLERSGVVTEGTDLEVGISYDTPYAVRQHEDLSYQHDAGRNAKFLENACRSERNTAAKIIQKSIKSATGD